MRILKDIGKLAAPPRQTWYQWLRRRLRFNWFWGGF